MDYSKLANILFTRELGRRLAASGAVANCFHPGFVQTGFALNNGGVLASLVKVGGSLFARSPEKGAETLIWLATSPEAASLNGAYCHDKRVAKTKPVAQDAALASQFWDFSRTLCGLS